MKTSLSAGQLLRARRLNGTGLSAELIAYRCGATVKQIVKAIDAPTMMPKRSKKKQKTYPTRTATAQEPFGRLAEPHHAKVPDEVWAECLARKAMEPRSLTAVLMGDPPSPDWHKRA
jgi:hypothetical protein